MKAGKAKRRWLKWCCYVSTTQSETSNWRLAGSHAGQAKAYERVMFSGRYVPIGARNPWYPRWGSVK